MLPATLELAPCAGPAAADDGEWSTDRVASAVIVVLFSMMANRFGVDFVSTGRLTGLLLLVSEALVVVLTVMRGRLSRSIAAPRALVDPLSVLGPPLAAAGDSRRRWLPNR